MDRAAEPVAIAGAGIAGLTAALAFAGAGFQVRVFERAERLDEVGAGLQLSPNATRILGRLGVLDALAPVATRPQAVEMRDARSLRLLASLPLGPEAERRWGAPYLAAHRADLQAALLHVAGRDARIEMLTGSAARGVTFRDGQVRLLLDRDNEQRCLLAVGADGVWSVLRDLAGQRRASSYTGYLAWRAMATPSAGIVPGDRVTTFLHRRFHIVAYPVRSGARINLVAVTRGASAARSWASAADAASLHAVMKGAAPALQDLVAAAGPWTTWPIHETPAGAWTDPRGLALVGDAAHAMSPYAAQGAAMAIEDAAVLSNAVAANPRDMAAALWRYEQARRGRVERVARRGAFNRFAWHAGGPVALARDLVLRLRPPESLASDLDWLYGYDAAPGDVSAGSG